MKNLIDFHDGDGLYLMNFGFKDTSSYAEAGCHSPDDVMRAIGYEGGYPQLHDAHRRGLSLARVIKIINAEVSKPPSENEESWQGYMVGFLKKDILNGGWVDPEDPFIWDVFHACIPDTAERVNSWESLSSWVLSKKIERRFSLDLPSESDAQAFIQRIPESIEWHCKYVFPNVDCEVLTQIIIDHLKNKLAALWYDANNPRLWDSVRATGLDIGSINSWLSFKPYLQKRLERAQLDKIADCEANVERNIAYVRNGLLSDLNNLPGTYDTAQLAEKISYTFGFRLECYDINPESSETWDLISRCIPEIPDYIKSIEDLKIWCVQALEEQAIARGMRNDPGNTIT